MSTKVAVVLSGSGVYDGSEIHEASSALSHLSRKHADVSIFAPDKPQMHVVDHISGSEMPETRNVLKESARIARGKISPLSDLKVENFDALVIPGGFGAAKNLSDFAVKGADMTVDESLSEKVKGFHNSQKPIGMCCIAPVIAARLIPGVEVTVGHDKDEGGKWPYAGTAEAIDKMGGKHIVTEVTEAHVDANNKVVTTAAFMCETGIHEVSDGINEMISHILKLAK